jgi:hypothetical protein
MSRARRIGPPVGAARAGFRTPRSRFSGSRSSILCLLSSIVLLTTAGAGEGPTEPVPLRRVLLTPDRLPQEMKRVQQGALVRIPRDEFEELVRRAARGAGREVPQLVEARYRAALAEEALVGTGQWKVVHTGPGPGLLNLQPNPQQPFNLALKQPRFENREALVAEFDGKSLALLVDEPGEHPVALEWSARGEARPEGLYFDLRVPACPVASLELDVPADRVVAVLDRALLSGPHPAEKPDRRLWKVACGGRGQVRLLVRRPTLDGSSDRDTGASLLLARQKTVQRLNPEGVEATFEFTLEALHAGVRELVCECDSSLRPTEVTVANLDTWEFRPGTGSGGDTGTPAGLIIRLREPLREGTLQVRCLAPMGVEHEAPSAERQAVAWTSPWIRLRGAVPRGETLELSFHPDLRIEDWHAGGFQVTGTAPVDPERPGSPQRLSLTGGGVGPEGAPAGTPPLRPSARLRPGGVQFRARQLAWWQLRATGMALTLQIHYEVIHGQLFELPILLPDDWDIDEVELTPPQLLRSWGMRPSLAATSEVGSLAARGQVLVVDLQRPLRAGPRPEGAGASRAATLILRLRPVRPGPVTGRKLPFPESVPLGALFREGALAIEFDEQTNEATVETRAVRSDRAEEDGPWGKQLPEYYFPYRGGRVRGALLLHPRPPQVRARCATAVFLASGRAAVEERLMVESEGGHPDTLDLYLSAGGAGPWDWRVQQGANQVRRVERLNTWTLAGVVGLFAAGNAVEATTLQAARPHGEHWRLTLARPLRPREPLLLYATRKLEPVAGRWVVPLPSVLGATRMEGEVTLHLAGADLVQVEAAGLHEAPPTAPPILPKEGGTPSTIPPAQSWRSFRYGPGAMT